MANLELSSLLTVTGKGAQASLRHSPASAPRGSASQAASGDLPALGRPASHTGEGWQASVYCCEKFAKKKLAKPSATR